MKSLRLHKYTEVLTDLTYEELLALDEAELQRRGFTNGAMGKFLKQLALVRERPEKLAELNAALNVSSAFVTVLCNVTLY